MTNDVTLQEQEDDFNSEVQAEIEKLIRSGVDPIEAKQRVYEKYGLDK